MLFRFRATERYNYVTNTHFEISTKIMKDPIFEQSLLSGHVSSPQLDYLEKCAVEDVFVMLIRESSYELIWK